jgi:dihydropteroate synthase
MTVVPVQQQATETRRSLRCGERFLDLSRPQVMGVLNITPDSFSDGGQYHNHGCLNLDKALSRVEEMLGQGATIVDIGGESTRPGADPVALQEEMQRVLPVVEAIARRFDIVISVDTSSPELMLAAASHGAGMINDVRALQRPGALQAAQQTCLPVCLMHMQGQPASMQKNPQYTDVVAEVVTYLQARVQSCLEAGIDSARIVLDPGFGFGKSLQHNLQLLNRLQDIQVLGYPLLVGLSRKSIIGGVLNRNIDQRLAGSLALAVLAVERGATIIRVHDVAETVDAISLCVAVKNSVAAK